jgi:ketosteroid isomerase-like protein
MYRLLVRRLVRRSWRQIAAGNYEAVVRKVGPGFRFRFLGDTPLAADLSTAEEWREWWARANRLLPSLRFELLDVLVDGWPWSTRVATRLAISATLADGTPYENTAFQFVTLRWGRLGDDIVMEDTQRLADALRPRATTA